MKFLWNILRYMGLLALFAPTLGLAEVGQQGLNSETADIRVKAELEDQGLFARVQGAHIRALQSGKLLLFQDKASSN